MFCDIWISNPSKTVHCLASYTGAPAAFPGYPFKSIVKWALLEAVTKRLLYTSQNTDVMVLFSINWQRDKSYLHKQCEYSFRLHVSTELLPVNMTDEAITKSQVCHHAM